MSDVTRVHHFVANLGTQPVELHLPSGLLVLPPRGRAEISAADLQSQQLQVLCASRLVMISQRAAPDQEKLAPETPLEPERPAPEAERPDSPKAEG